MEYFNNLIASLTTKVGELVPGMAGALVVLLIGWAVAVGVRKLVLILFERTKLNEKINSRFSSGFEPARFIARLFYYLILIYTLLLVLDMMGVEGVLAPLSNMLNEFLGFFPNIVAATVIGFAGYVIAKIASEAVAFVGESIEQFSQKAGLKSQLNLVALVKQVVFVLVFVPLLITALDALKMEVISAPATAMFNDFLSAIPQILAAALIIAIVYIIGRYVTNFLADLLANLGLDKLAQPLGVTKMTRPDLPLSKLIGYIAFFFIMFGGIIGGIEKLGMPQITGILNDIFDISGRIFFGLVIFFIGNLLSDLAKQALEQSEDSKWLGTLAKIAVLFIFLALGLNTMGIGEEIVNLAFGLVVGALAVAFALAYGLGGRAAAGQHFAGFLERLKNKSN